MSVKAVLFDFDGVVVQSELLHRKTFLDVLSPFGIRVSEERWFREFAGTGSRNIITRLMNEAGVKKDVDGLMAVRRDLYAEHIKRGELRLVKGILGFLQKLKEMDIKCAVVSGGHSSNVNLALDRVGLRDFFGVVIGAEDITKRKPDPEGYLVAAQRLGVGPSECIIIEDSIAGATAAKAAGMKFVIVKSPISRSIEGYAALINDYGEFPAELLKG